jgi:hypothetical protein
MQPEAVERSEAAEVLSVWVLRSTRYARAMARTTTWRRHVGSLVDDGSYGPRHEVTTVPIFPGETLTRVRFHYWISTDDEDLPFYGVGTEIVMALQVYAPGDIPVVRFPVTHLDDDWLWWEAATMDPRIVTVADGHTFSRATGPAYGGERDVKSQRGPIEGADAWFLVLQTQASVTASGGHQLSYGLSALVLDPA